MEGEEAERILLEVQAARREDSLRGPAPDRERRNEALWKAHALAEAKYLPASAFFRSCLTDPEAEWRLSGLQALGFHYDTSADEELLERIRYMLLTDPDMHVRIAAASILGTRSRWPDWALQSALESEPVRTVRAVVFESLLKLAGAPLTKAREAYRRIEIGEIEPTREQLESFAGQMDVSLPILE